MFAISQPALKKRSLRPSVDRYRLQLIQQKIKDYRIAITLNSRVEVFKRTRTKLWYKKFEEVPNWTDSLTHTLCFMFQMVCVKKC